MIEIAKIDPEFMLNLSSIMKSAANFERNIVFFLQVTYGVTQKRTDLTADVEDGT